MISRNEHNYIVDTLIKRIEQLEAETAAKDSIVAKLRTEHELLLLDYEALVKLNNHKDEVIKRLKNKEGR